MLKLNNAIILGAVVVAIYLINRTFSYKKVPTLAELNPNGGKSIFEKYPVR